MKRFILTAVAIATMSVCLPVYAAEMTVEQKDECLLASVGCRNQVDTIQQKITRLNVEIKKGDKVYTTAEINKLTGKLKEAEALLDTLLRGE